MCSYQTLQEGSSHISLTLGSYLNDNESLFVLSIWFNPLIHRHHPILGQSWLENIFSERKKKISGGRSGNSFCPDDDVGKVSWLTLIQNCLYTWDTDNNDNIIADIPHNMDPHLYNPGSEYKIQIFSPLQTEWCGWTAWTVNWVTVSTYWNILTKRVMLLSRMCHTTSTEIFLMDYTRIFSSSGSFNTIYILLRLLLTSSDIKIFSFQRSLFCLSVKIKVSLI